MILFPGDTQRILGEIRIIVKESYEIREILGDYDEYRHF
jgi:hypothetical protein